MKKYSDQILYFSHTLPRVLWSQCVCVPSSAFPFARIVDGRKRGIRVTEGAVTPLSYNPSPSLGMLQKPDGQFGPRRQLRRQRQRRGLVFPGTPLVVNPADSESKLPPTCMHCVQDVPIALYCIQSVDENRTQSTQHGPGHTFFKNAHLGTPFKDILCSANPSVVKAMIVKRRNSTPVACMRNVENKPPSRESTPPLPFSRTASASPDRRYPRGTNKAALGRAQPVVVFVLFASPR